MGAGQSIDLGRGVTLYGIMAGDDPMIGANAGLVLNFDMPGERCSSPAISANRRVRPCSEIAGSALADVMVGPHQGIFDASAADLSPRRIQAWYSAPIASELTDKQTATPTPAGIARCFAPAIAVRSQSRFAASGVCRSYRFYPRGQRPPRELHRPRRPAPRNRPGRRPRPLCTRSQSASPQSGAPARRGL